MCIGQWPIFHCPVILPYILKTIFWTNPIIGVLVPCDAKAYLIKCMLASDLHFMVQWFFLISWRIFDGWLCWGLTSQSTIFQSCRDGAIASWVINQYFRGVKCLAQGHNTAAVGFEPRTPRSGVRHSTTEPPRSPNIWWINVVLEILNQCNPNTEQKLHM